MDTTIQLSLMASAVSQRPAPHPVRPQCPATVADSVDVAGERGRKRTRKDVRSPLDLNRLEHNELGEHVAYASWSRDKQFQEKVDEMQKAGFVTKVVFALLHPGEPPQHLLYCYPFPPPNPAVFDDEEES